MSQSESFVNRRSDGRKNVYAREPESNVPDSRNTSSNRDDWGNACSKYRLILYVLRRYGTRWVFHARDTCDALSASRRLKPSKILAVSLSGSVSMTSETEIEIDCLSMTVERGGGGLKGQSMLGNGAEAGRSFGCGFGMSQEVQQSVVPLGGGNFIATHATFLFTTYLWETLSKKRPGADGICIKLVGKLGFDCDRRYSGCTSKPIAGLELYCFSGSESLSPEGQVN